jgi:hypothetical protein
MDYQKLENAIMERQGKVNGKEIFFLCPMHDDHHPSARYNPEKRVWTCDVCNKGGSAADLAKRLGVDTASTSIFKRDIFATYDYGEFQVVRTMPKGFYQRRPDGAGGWIYNLKGISPCLYHADELAPAIENGNTVYIVEGEKDVDCLRALSLTATCNPMGAGKWRPQYSELLTGADLVIIPDNDTPGHAHAEAVCKSCHGKAARIRTITLPAGKDASEWLDSGGDIDTLKEIVAKTPEYKQAQAPKLIRFSSQYDVIDGVMCWLKSTSEGISEVPLCNFNARVTQDITRDNGVEGSRFFRIEGSLPSGDKLDTIETTAASFSSLSWVTSEWGMRTVISAGSSSKDRLREAIQLQSMQARRRIVYTHTGWREIDGEMTFLTAAGAMGREDVEVEMDSALQRYQLLEPAGDPREAIQKSLEFLKVAPPETTMPLWAAMYLAPLTEFIDTSFTLWMEGASGSFKSTITSLALCHFGTFDSRHLPASWTGTPNQLEHLLFLAKDLPFVIDDWAPGQDSSKARELEAKAERIVRAQGNRQGRVRMKSDATSQTTYVPRGLLITSGEQLPSGHSHTARIYSVGIERENVNLQRLSAAQEAQYNYCKAMSHYIDWIRHNYQHLKATLPKMWRDYRDSALEKDTHPRMPEVIAGLSCAMNMATEYAVEYGAITDAAAGTLFGEAWDIFCKLAEEQSGRIEDERPATRAIAIWRAMLDQGVAVLWSKDDEAPRVPPPGARAIGWLEQNNGSSNVLLNPMAAHGALVEYGQKFGQPFTIKEQALWKDMARMGYLDSGTGSRLTKVARIYGTPKRVYQIKYRVLCQKSGNSGNSDEI